MAPPKDAGARHHALDQDVDFAGYDPYIVALTGGRPVEVRNAEAGTSEQPTESRKVKLMTWLREHRG